MGYKEPLLESLLHFMEKYNGACPVLVKKERSGSPLRK